MTRNWTYGRPGAPVGRWARAILVLAAIVGSSALAATPAIAASPPQPTYGSAVVDGHYGDWNLSNDFFQGMYTAGDPSKPLLANGYLRYDCSTQTLYVLVLQAGLGTSGAIPLLTTSGDSWATIDGDPHKEYTDGSGDGSSPPQFAWVGQGYDGNSNHVQGYEASFTLAPGSYTIVVHAEADDGGSQTAAFPGFNKNFGSPTQLVIDCSSPPPPPPPAPAFTLGKTQAIAGSGQSPTSSPLSGTVGQVVDYTITATNTGNTELTFGSLSDSHCDPGTIAGGSSGAVAPNATVTFTCQHTLSAADAAAGSYSNTASISATPPSGDGGAITESSNTVTTTVTSAPPPPPSYSPAFTLSKTQSVLQPGSPSSGPNSNDQLTVEKQEQFIGLAGGQTKTVTLSCPSGYEVLDGSPLVQEVDQGSGTPADILLVQSQSTSTSAYTFTLTNPTSGNAQAQGFVTCVQQASTDGGQVAVSQQPLNATVQVGAGSSSTQTLSCPTGDVAVDPGYDFTSGVGTITSSSPSSDLSSWTFTVSAAHAASVTLQIRCLAGKTADGDSLSTQELTQQVTVPAGQTQTAEVICPTGYKGVVASYTLPAGLALLGDEPQPITRVFTLQNTGTSAATATLDLVCLLDTTSGGSGSSTSTPFTSGPLNAAPGDVVNYEITATNTGNTPLTFSGFADSHCDAGTLAGGPSGTVAPSGSVTWTCSHTLTAADGSAGSYDNVASVTGTPPSGEGAAITQSSNTVLVNLSGSANAQPQVTVAPQVVSGQVRVSVEVAAPSSTVSVALYGISARANRAGAAAAILYGNVIRRGASGHVSLLVALNRRARAALARSGILRARLQVTLTPPHGRSQWLVREVTLRAGAAHGVGRSRGDHRHRQHRRHRHGRGHHRHHRRHHRRR